MKMSHEELARRFAEADRMVLILRRATLDMQAVRAHVLAKRRQEKAAAGSSESPRK